MKRLLPPQYPNDPDALFDEALMAGLSGNVPYGDDMRTLETGPNTTMPVVEPSVMEPPAAPVPPAAPSPVNTRETRDALGGYAGVGTMRGFNTGDYGGDTKARNSVKNTFGRIASRYAGNPGSMDAIFQDADFLRYFPNASRIEGGAGDKIDFGGVLSDFESGAPVGAVDVGEAFDPANNTGAGWQWIDLENDAGGDGDAAIDDLPLGGTINGLLGSTLGQAPQDDTLAAILEEIQRLMSGNPDALLAGAIEEQMR